MICSTIWLFICFCSMAVGILSMITFRQFNRKDDAKNFYTGIILTALGVIGVLAFIFSYFLFHAR